MSDTPDPKAPPPSAASARSTASPPASRPATGMRLDPAAAMIGVGGVVLLLALWWLWATPRADRAADADDRRLAQIEQRLDTARDQASAASARLAALPALEQRVGQLGEVEARLRALEARPAPDLHPVETQLATIGERVAALDRRVQALEARPTPEAIAADLRRQGEEAARATQQRLDALDQGLSQRLGALDQGLSQRLATLEKDVPQRLDTLERGLPQRLGALEQGLTQRITAAEQGAAQRQAALEASARDTRTALEQQVGQRLAGVETTVTQRLASMEQEAQRRVAALEGRVGGLGAVDAARAALAAGQPLGPALAKLPNPPPALARYATAAPPTMAALRLSFEEAAKAALAAADPAAHGPEGARGGIVDSALARLGGLVTVRRGEEVVWGNAADEEIARARRALEAGDLEIALSRLGRLPPPARQAMQGWTDQARGLLDAEAALRQLAGGQGSAG